MASFASPCTGFLDSSAALQRKSHKLTRGIKYSPRYIFIHNGSTPRRDSHCCHQSCQLLYACPPLHEGRRALSI